MNKDNTLQVTSASEWASWAAGEVVRLPLGKAVRLMPVDVIDMIMADGSVYDMFSTMQETGEQIAEDNFEAMAEQYPKLKPFLEDLTLAAIGEPVVVRDNANLQAGEIPVKWILTADRLFIFKRVFGEAQSLAALFPQEQSGNVYAASSSDELRAAAKQLGGAGGES